VMNAGGVLYVEDDTRLPAALKKETEQKPSCECMISASLPHSGDLLDNRAVKLIQFKCFVLLPSVLLLVQYAAERQAAEPRLRALLRKCWYI
jgi:hypothetical protein